MILTRGRDNQFVLEGATDVAGIVRDHGWNVYGGNVLTTDCHYAAMVFADYATPGLLGEWYAELEEIEASWSDDSGAHIKCPDDQELWPFQRAGVAYSTRRTHSLIGDQPGLGKTAQAICLANDMGARRVLVLCPANIRLQWAKAIRSWSTMAGRPVIYPILKSADGVHPRAEWTIISYDLTRSEPIMEALCKGHYDLLVLDEAHYLKTPDAKRTHAVLGEKGLISHAEKAVALTGTPLPNRPKECYTLARGLAWGSVDYMSEDRFKDRFNPSVKMEVYDPASGKLKVFTKESVGRLPELQNRLRVNFMVRRLKRDVLTQLPQVRYEIQHVEETGAIRKALEAEKMLDIDPENMAGVDAKVLGHVSVVRHMMGVAKAPQVAEYVRMLIDGGEEKIVLFGWHIAVLDILEQRLQDLGLVRIDGGTSPTRRQAHVDRFQTDAGVRICLGNLQAMGIGTDGLQNVCSHAVFAECSWVPADNEQGVGRLERIGQNTAVIAEFMVAPGSFDEKVLGSSLRKLRHINSALDKEHA